MTTNMNKGVQILLDRMESNPDEFLPVEPFGNPPSKWSLILMGIQDRMERINNSNPDAPYVPHHKTQLCFLSDEEVIALQTKYNAIQAEVFTQQVMEILLVEADDKRNDSSFAYSQAVSGGLLPKQQIDTQMKIELLKAQAKHTNSIARVFGNRR